MMLLYFGTMLLFWFCLYVFFFYSSSFFLSLILSFSLPSFFACEKNQPYVEWRIIKKSFYSYFGLFFVRWKVDKGNNCDSWQVSDDWNLANRNWWWWLWYPIDGSMVIILIWSLSQNNITQWGGLNVGEHEAIRKRKYTVISLVFCQ